MKTNAIVRIVLYSIVILVLLGLLLIGLGFGSYMYDSEIHFGNFIINSGSNASIDGTVSSTGSLPADQIRDISIEWAAGSITIQPGDTDTISFSEAGTFDEDSVMVWKQSGDKLTIQFEKPQVIFGISYEGSKKDLTITVPRDWTCGSLEIDAASAQVNITDLTIREVDFDGASGICTFENCQVGQLEIDTASGDVKLTGVLSELDFAGMSSSFTAVLTNTPSRMNMDSMSGDLDITLPSSAGFTASIDAMSSDFSSDFPTTKQNGKYICGDGSCRISVSAMSGDVIIRMGE